MSGIHYWLPGRDHLVAQLERDVRAWLSVHPGWTSRETLLALAPEGIKIEIDDLEAETPYGSDWASGPVHLRGPSGRPDGRMLEAVLTHLRDEGIVEEGYPPGNGRSFRLYGEEIRLPDDDEPMGLQEIAGRLRVMRATADQWRARGLLPDPDWTVGGRPAWRWGAIRRWAAQSGRLPAAEVPGRA